MTPYASGERWVLYHGSMLDVLAALPADSLDAIATDPPYGLGAGVLRGSAWDARLPTGQEWAGCWHVLKPAGWLAFCISPLKWHECAPSLFSAGFKVADVGAWVWSLGRPPARDRLRRLWDVVPFVYRPPRAELYVEQARGLWSDAEIRATAAHRGRTYIGGNMQPNGYHGSFRWPGNVACAEDDPALGEWAPIFAVPRVRDYQAVDKHPTEKPVELYRQLVRLTSRPGETVLDPWCGSGTTLAAALSEGRRAIGCDREARYLDLAARRLHAAEAQPCLPLAPARRGEQGRLRLGGEG